MTKVTVKIKSRTTDKWAIRLVNTMSEAIQLTHGLTTEWNVTSTAAIGEDCELWAVQYANRIELSQKYAHGLRALVQRWKRNWTAKHKMVVVNFGEVCRMDDKTLLASFAHSLTRTTRNRKFA